MTLKKREIKALELAEKKKQMTFDVPKTDVSVEKPKKGPKKANTTYWRCKKDHIFPMKFRVHPDRVEKLRCPICRHPIEGQSNETTYLFYLDRMGRGDKKKYRTSTGKLHTKREKDIGKLDVKPEED